MTITVMYPSKKELKACVGQKLKCRGTSMLSPEYKSDGKFSVCNRPRMTGFKRGFFAEVTMKNDLIEKVS